MKIACIEFEELIKRLRKNSDDLDCVFRTLLTGLEYDKMREFRNLNIEAKEAKLIQQAKIAKRDHRTKTWQEIVVDGILKAEDIPDSHVRYIFGHADSEADLYRMTARLFRDDSVVYDGDKGKIRIGMLDADRGSIPELIAVKHYSKKRVEPSHVWGPLSFGTKATRQPAVKVICVDVKTDGQQLKNFYHQATDYQMGSDEVYLATTSLLLLREGEKRILGKLKQFKVGLIHIDATTGKSSIVFMGKRGKNFRGAEKRRVVQKCEDGVGIQYRFS